MKNFLHKIARGTVYLIENTEKVFLRIVQVGLFITIIILMMEELNNFDKDTFTITNYGFAILLGLSSISPSCREIASRGLGIPREKVKK